MNNGLQADGNVVATGENETYFENGTQAEVVQPEIIGGRITTYKAADESDPVTLGRVDNVYELLLAEGKPVLLKDFTFSNSAKGSFPNGGSFSMPQNLYSMSQSVLAYDSKNNFPTTITDRSGLVTNFQWGYNGSFAINRTVASELNLYSSFEIQNEKGGWTYTGNIIKGDESSPSKTGSSHYNLNGGDIALRSLEAGKTYELSFWAKGGSPTVTNTIDGNGNAGVTDVNGWKYYSRTVKGSQVTISGANVLIDELRLIEEDGIARTFTYDALKGKTSETDENGSQSARRKNMTSSLKRTAFS